jgi:hypothetical protein
MKNKLILLLAAALGATSGMMMAADGQPQGSGPFAQISTQVHEDKEHVGGAAQNDDQSSQNTPSWAQRTRAGLGKFGTSMKAWPVQQYNNYTDGYKNAQWRGKSTRVARDVIHGANIVNMIAELGGDRNALLDALSLNKKLNANKNFAWLRKGKSKSARALRVLITLAQTGSILALNHYAFKKLVSMANDRDTAAGAPVLDAGGNGADQSTGASNV